MMDCSSELGGLSCSDGFSGVLLISSGFDSGCFCSDSFSFAFSVLGCSGEDGDVGGWGDSCKGICPVSGFSDKVMLSGVIGFGETGISSFFSELAGGGAGCVFSELIVWGTGEVGGSTGVSLIRIDKALVILELTC